MKKLIILTICALMALPVIARPASAQEETGREKMSEAFRLLLEGLSEELEPLSEDMSQAWREMLEDLDDLNVYEAPERLPNGDIIIRRKVPLPEGEVETSEPGESTEL